MKIFGRYRTEALLVLCVVLAAASFAFDLMTPLGVAAGIPYVAIVLIGLWLPWETASLVLAAIGTALTLLGYTLSVESQDHWMVITNRVLAIFAIWVAGILVYWRRQAERAFEKSKKTLESAQRLARLGSYEIDLSTSRLRWSNETFRIVGLDPAQGEPSLPGYLETVVHPDDRTRLSRAIIRAGETGQPYNVEYRILHSDGSLRHVHSLGTPIGESGARPSKIVGTLLDITERKRAEEAVKEREALLQSAIETAPEAIITIDEQGIIQTFSSSAEIIFGYSAAEAIGKNVSMLMPPPDRDKHDEYIARYLRTGERRIIGIGRVVEGRRKDGNVFPLELAVGEVEVDGRRIFTGFARDISDRQKMEQELRHAQKMEAIGQLTGGVAHDFNNLLTVIIGNLEMLEARLDDEGQHVALRQAMEAAELGSQLTERLLAFGRRQPLQPRIVDLGEVVSGMSSLLQRTLGEAIEVNTIRSRHLQKTLVDPGQIENVILNLAINARDAMPNGGRLTIETANAEFDEGSAAAHPDVRPGRYVMLSVTDTGTGMAPEVQERAFEPFFTTKGAGSGSGLGLSMVYGFVKQSDGHVRLSSEVDRGTTVTVYLPQVDRESESQGRQEPAAESYRSTGETVLVVEDNPRVRQVSVDRLRELGYAVVSAKDAVEALDLLAKAPEIDLLFTDVMLTGKLMGDALAEQVRQQWPDIKVVFTSGYAEPDIIRGGMLEKGAGWLRKPYTKDELARKLREVLDG